MNKIQVTIKLCVVLAALFCAGGASGYVISGKDSALRPAWTRSSEWAKAWTERRMKEDFDLTDATPAQRAAMQASYAQLKQEFDAIQAQASERLALAMRRHYAEVGASLTPEQREVLRRRNQEKVRQAQGK